MSNSRLVDVKVYSPHHSGRRTKKISKIAIHHMAGVMTARNCGAWFQKAVAQASSNYGIGYDGSIGLYVDEANRAWTTSSAWCDQQAVTIEVSNSSSGGKWPVSSRVLSRLIDLVYDIAKRNGIYPVTYTGDKSGTLQKHSWYANKLCPGPSLGAEFAYIAQEVTRRLRADRAAEPSKKVSVPMGKINVQVEEQDIISALEGQGYKVSKEATKKVKVTTDVLNVRQGPSTNTAIATTVKKGDVYTIIEEKDGWGKLKSGAGWISLAYTEEV